MQVLGALAGGRRGWGLLVGHDCGRGVAARGVWARVVIYGGANFCSLTHPAIGGAAAATGLMFFLPTPLPLSIAVTVQHACWH
jgi:hypothetical protein